LAGDWIVFMRSAGRILSTRFIDELLLAFEQFDIVSAAGAERVGGVRWFDAGFPAAHGALVLPNRGPVGGLTLSVYGPTHRRFHPHLRILDASLFAVRRSALSRVPFDLELDGEHDLCECDWFIRSSDAGLRLGAAPLLGVANFDANYRAGANWHDCAERFRDKHGLGDDGDAAVIAGASILLPSPDHAMPVLTRFYAV
jgi:hypothetical protein